MQSIARVRLLSGWTRRWSLGRLRWGAGRAGGGVLEVAKLEVQQLTAFDKDVVNPWCWREGLRPARLGDLENRVGRGTGHSGAEASARTGRDERHNVSVDVGDLDVPSGEP